MKPWIFMSLWVVFWMGLGMCLDKISHLTTAPGLCVLVSIVGGGTMLIYCIMDIAIKLIGG